VSTDTFAAGAILYPSPTVAGVWTDVEPVAPNIDMPIGFCINSHVNNGTIAIRVASGYKLSELHDVAISSPVESSSLYYKGGLWRDTTAALLTSDTASMLTNYLRTGTAASTYLPLTGGTLTGGLTGTTGTFTGLNVNNTTTQGIFTLQGADNNTPTRIDFKTGNEIRRQIIVPTAESNMQFITSTIGGTQGGYSFYTRRNPNPSEFLAFNIDVDGNSNFYGTIGVTGATTLSAPLTVNSSAVFNEAATDSDFRVESEANAHMLFVDASTSRVGIGYASPTKTLDVNGELRINTVTATPTSLLGKDASNVVGEVTTVAQTGLMTRGETTATTGSPSATFTVTHGLGATPTSVLVTSAGLAGAEKIIFEVYTKNSTTFSVQAWNYDGTEASSKSVKIFWLAIK